MAVKRQGPGVRQGLPNKPMNCLICRQAVLVDGLTSISFERGEMNFTVHHVPAQICPHCGEAFVAESATIHLLNTAEAASAEGLWGQVREYDGNC